MGDRQKAVFWDGVIGDALIMMTFRHIAHFRLGPLGGEMHVRTPWRSSLEPVSHIGAGSCFDIGAGSCFDQISKANALVGIIGIFVGLYVYSSAAFAEVEEETNQAEGSYNYSIIRLSRGATANFSVDGITNIDDRLEFTSFKDPTRFDEALIPEAVWGVDASVGDHPGRVSGGFGSETHTIFSVDLESISSGTDTTVYFSDGKRQYSLLSPPQFQVASCGGSSAEHRDLNYCKDRDNNSGYSVSNSNTPQPDPSTSTAPDTDNSVTISDSTSSSSLNTQSNFAQFAPFVRSVPLRLGNLTLQDPCDAASVSCLTVQIDQPAMQFSSTTTAPALLTISVPPSVSPTPPIDDLAPSIDPSPPEDPPLPISVDAPGLGVDLPSGFIPPTQKPIPEIPTWAMILIGFSIVVLIFGPKRKNRVNQI